MELPDVGKHCEYPGCNVLDFLPIKCDACQKIFCKGHSSYENHQCPSWDSSYLPGKLKNNDPGRSPVPQTFGCQFPGCAIREQFEITCPDCQLTYCMKHRLKEDHKCEGIRSKPYMPKTNMLVNTLVSESEQKIPYRQRRPLSAKAQKTAAKVQLMKVKMNSIGDKNLSQDERIFFRVHLPLRGKSQNVKEKWKNVYVSKLWSIGRVVDGVAKLCGVENKNNVAGHKKLRLFKHSDGILMTNKLDTLLDTLLTTETVFNGDSLIMEYVEPEEAKADDFRLDVSHYK